MKLKVMKFGGTSLANDDTITHAIKKIMKQVQDGYRVLVVVSAMGREGACYATDTLLQLLQGKVSVQERDRLMSVGETISSIVLSARLNSLGLNSYALGNEENGLISDTEYGQASIIKTEHTKIKELLQLYDVIIAPGFQAHTEDYHITTLGRGGSDYSAMLYAVMLGLDEVFIYTDVDGVYNADPKVFPDAVRYEIISYDELISFIQRGDRVMQLQSLYYAKQYRLKICIGSTTEEYDGTWVIAR